MAGGPEHGPSSPGLGRKGPGSAGAPFGRRFLIGGLVVALVYAVFPARSPAPLGTPSSTFKTPGVKNVENAFANGGGTTTHVKGYGGSIQGTKGAEGLRQNGGTNKPRGFEHEGIGEEQRPTQPTKVGEAFNEFKYGSPTGK